MDYDFVCEADGFSLADTLECGQCFRFVKNPDKSYSGVALGRGVTLWQDSGRLFATGFNERLFACEYRSYFALDVDYAAIHALFEEDAVLMKAVEFAPGIRVLRQPLFETLISFILSQNNNIKRIGGIIERLCEKFGERLEGGVFDFPTPEALAGKACSDLAELRCGYRDAYVLDAAERWAKGVIDRDVVMHAPLADARRELARIKGVGPKVADCVLLFGAARYDAFPEDVWIKRAMGELFPGGLPEPIKPYAGIAQQYIYHFARAHFAP